MAISPFKTFVAGEVLTASDLNASLTTITNGGVSLISPLTGNLNMGGFGFATSPVVLSGVAMNEAQGGNIASATTADIGAATGNYVKVTGTTAITGLGTVQAGTRRMVEFTGALTLTHNASNLILPDAANIATAAGDTAIFVSEGSGNWRLISYQRASTAWTAYSPSVITSVGALTSVTALARYIQIGKLVSVIINIGITTNGTGAGFVVVTLPAAVASNLSIAYVAYGRNSNGKMLQGDVNAGTATLNVVNYDNTYPGFDGAALKVAMTYESL